MVQPKPPVRFHFTRKSIDAVPIPAKKRTEYHDSGMRGLHLMVQPSGHRAFYWYRKVDGRPRYQSIGECDSLSVEQARDAAGQLNAKLAQWKAANYETDDPFSAAR